MSQDHLVPIPVDRRGGPAREQHVLQGRHQVGIGRRRVAWPPAEREAHLVRLGLGLGFAQTYPNPYPYPYPYP